MLFKMRISALKIKIILELRQDIFQKLQNDSNLENSVGGNQKKKKNANACYFISAHYVNASHLLIFNMCLIF